MGVPDNKSRWLEVLKLLISRKKRFHLDSVMDLLAATQSGTKYRRR